MKKIKLSLKRFLKEAEEVEHEEIELGGHDHAGADETEIAESDHLFDEALQKLEDLCDHYKESSEDEKYAKVEEIIRHLRALNPETHSKATVVHAKVSDGSEKRTNSDPTPQQTNTFRR